MAGFVDADKRVFYDPPPADSDPTSAKRSAKRAQSHMNGSFPAWRVP